jgi:hypothetical protein
MTKARMRTIIMCWSGCLVAACTHGANDLVGNYVATSVTCAPAGDSSSDNAAGLYLLVSRDGSGGVTITTSGCDDCPTMPLVADGMGGFGSGIGSATMTTYTDPNVCGSAGVPCQVCDLGYQGEQLIPSTNGTIVVDSEAMLDHVVNPTSCTLGDEVAIQFGPAYSTICTIAATPTNDVTPIYPVEGSP